MNNRFLTICVALLAVSSTAQAAPIFTGSLGLNNSCASNITPTTSSAPIFITANWTCGINPLLSATGTSQAGPGTLGVSTRAINATGGEGNGTLATASAGFGGIFIITGPAGGPSSIPVSLNLHMTGFTALTGGRSAWSMELSSVLFGGGTLASNAAGTGMLAGLPSGNDVLINSSITTPTRLLGVGQTVLIGLGWTVRAEAGLPGTAEINFLNTLSFPTNGPVFNLPDGYTINSPDLGIVNNRFVTDGGSGVPEPASLVLTGVGLVAAGLLRKRRRH